MNLANSGLSRNTIEKLNRIFEKHSEVGKVVLYGSRAAGTFKPGSDIDLTIVSDSISVSQLSRIESEIDDLDLPNKVDLSIFSHIDNPDLIDHIHRKGIDFFTRNQ